jgi:hypothetical protein
MCILTFLATGNNFVCTYLCKSRTVSIRNSSENELVAECRSLNDCFSVVFRDRTPRPQITTDFLVFGIGLSGGIMARSGRRPAFLTHFVRKLRGASQAILSEASDGLLYVVKFNNNLQGRHVPFNESMGTELYQAAGLPVPQWRPVLLTRSFIDQNPSCWMETPEGKLRPEEGLCFGSQFLGCEDVRLFEILPASVFKRVLNGDDFWLAWLLDICAIHVDNRQAIFRQNEDYTLDAVFFDHGHMFGGPKGSGDLRFDEPCYLDRRIYSDVSSKLTIALRKAPAKIDADRLWSRLQVEPEDWKSDSALLKFAECLQTLSQSRAIERVVDTMADCHRRFPRITADAHP